MLAAWAARYLHAPGRAPAAGPVRRDRDRRRASSQQAVAVGPHRLFADEPVAVGGSGTGPDPYDSLAVALGACTAMTMRMYARRKDLPLRRVR